MVKNWCTNNVLISKRGIFDKKSSTNSSFYLLLQSGTFKLNKHNDGTNNMIERICLLDKYKLS